MSEDDVTAREELAVAQRALAKAVDLERDISELEDETAALRSELNEVDQRLSEQEAAAAEDGGEADV